METFYVNGYRIAARNYNQALIAARLLKKGEYPFNWPGERDWRSPTEEVKQ